MASLAAASLWGDLARELPLRVEFLGKFDAVQPQPGQNISDFLRALGRHTPARAALTGAVSAPSTQNRRRHRGQPLHSLILCFLCGHLDSSGRRRRLARGLRRLLASVIVVAQTRSHLMQARLVRSRGRMQICFWAMSPSAPVQDPSAGGLLRSRLLGYGGCWNTRFSGCPTLTGGPESWCCKWLRIPSMMARASLSLSYTHMRMPLYQW